MFFSKYKRKKNEILFFISFNKFKPKQLIKKINRIMSNNSEITIDFDDETYKLFKSLTKKTIDNTLNSIAKAYDLDREELNSKITYSYPSKNDMNKKSKKPTKPKKLYPLPWCPAYVNTDTKCNAIVSNKNLFTQCQRNLNSKDIENGHKYCSICRAKPENTYMANGTITDRLNSGIYDYKAPNGNIPSPFLNYVPNDVSHDDVKDYFKSLGYVDIPEEHFIQPRTTEKITRKKKPSLHIESINNSPTIDHSIISPISSPTPPPPSPPHSSPKKYEIGSESPKPIVRKRKTTAPSKSAGSC